MANKPQANNTDTPHGFAGPGYAGFGGSAGYSGSGQGGIIGGYAGGGPTEGPWRPVPDTWHDDHIASVIRERLAEGRGFDASQVEVEAGIVYLNGEIATRTMKHAVGEVAKHVAGVHRVHNDLHVTTPFFQELRAKLRHAPT
ncbi:MAG TPA: BON domain-containing protein [Polyangiaceae bacterium]|nr:BON domain-containing protein [Polyangiaceae bacterium]